MNGDDKKDISPKRFSLFQPAILQSNLNDFDRSASNQLSESFSFRIQQPYSVDSDPTICWKYNVPQLKPNEKQLFILTEAFQTIILDYIGESFPSCISFGIKGLSGYIDKKGNVTNKFIVMDLVNTAIKSSQTGIISRDLTYKAQMYNIWSLGLMRDLELYIYVDD